MLLALRHIVEADPPLPVRVGVNRGPVFTAQVGPDYRRWYAVMGDTREPRGAADGQGAGRSRLRDPRGAARCEDELRADRGSSRSRSRASHVRYTRGMSAATLRGASEGSDPARAAAGRPATPSSTTCGPRSARASRRIGDADRARGRDGQRQVAAARRGWRGSARGWPSCAPVARSTRATRPYSAWRGLLRQAARRWTRTRPSPWCSTGSSPRSTTNRPELLPWLSLIAIVLDVEVPPSAEVERLAEDVARRQAPRGRARVPRPRAGRPDDRRGRAGAPDGRRFGGAVPGARARARVLRLGCRWSRAATCRAG